MENKEVTESVEAKEAFVPAEAEIVEFEETDIITTSFPCDEQLPW